MCYLTKKFSKKGQRNQYFLFIYLRLQLHSIAAEPGNVLEEKGHHSSCRKEVQTHTHLHLIQHVKSQLPLPYLIYG